MEKKTASAIMLTLLLTSMLTLAFSTSFVKAVTDPIISGLVRDKAGNPIPNVLIVARDVSTEIDVASATSIATGAYTMSVPLGTYNLIITPPPESGFSPTTISNIEVTKDTIIDIVLVPAETFTFSGLVVDRDGNPVSNVNVYVYSAAISKSSSTNEQGFYSMQIPPDSYSLSLYNYWSYIPNVPQYFSLYKTTTLNITQDTEVTFTLQNRYFSGKVVDPYGNPVADVSIYVNSGCSFDDLSGWFEAWATSDSDGNFNVTVFASSSVSLRATPPAESPWGPVSVTINMTEDADVTVTLTQTVTFSGLVVDRESNPIPNVNVYVYSSSVSRSVTTDNQGLFSIHVPPDSYSVSLYNYWSYVPNVPTYFSLYKTVALNIVEDTYVTFTLQNRYLSGKVDCEGKPVANVGIYVNGGTSFDDFSGWFEAWATTDSEGKFNVTVFTSISVSIKATPPPESIYAPVNITNVDMTDDKMVLIALFYKAGVLPTANFTWNPETPEVGESVAFDASASIPGSGIIIRHKWSFGDGTYAVGKTVTHSYTTPGVYTVTLNVTNSKGLWDIEQKQIQVVEPAPGPKPPVASFTYSPANPKVDEEVTFDASASFDPDGQIVSYNWNFGDGFAGEGKIVTHSYSKEGNYKVTLTAVDNDGKASSTSKTVTVVKPKMDERIEKAVAWALNWTDGPPYPEGNPPYSWKCLGFVLDAYKYGAGVDPREYIMNPEDFSYAKRAAEALKAKDNRGIPPRGAYVFYDCWGTLTDWGYDNWGHVGLSVGNGEVVHAWGEEFRIDNYLAIQNLSPGGDWTNPQYIGWAYPPLKPPIKTSGLSLLATCPVDLVVIDPDYVVISKEYSEIPGAVYIEEDFNGDGSPDDYVFIPERKTGEYLITVIPELGADPTATYTLEVSSEGVTFLLAENVPISDIPTEPYVIASTTFEPPPLSASISPLSASILTGHSVTFTSTVSGGYTPYSYQWYLNGNPVSGATSNTWAFTPTTGGIYYIHLKVTDDKANTAQSDAARITVEVVPVGGYSFPIQVPAKAEPVLPYIALIAILTAVFTKLRPKTKRKR